MKSSKIIFFVSNALSSSRINYFLNKNHLNELAVKHGLNVAKSWNVKKGDIPNDLAYPIITKNIDSNSGAWKEDYYICNNKNELELAYQNIKGENLILQQYIVKKTEVCLDGVYLHKGEQNLAIASTYTYALPDNYSAEMIVSNYKDIPHYEQVKSSLDDMFKEIGFDGIYSVEFMLDNNNESWFLEINFRPSTWNYAATKLGMNLSILWSLGQVKDIFFKKF
jgi:D-aspartate ligase